ncbi:MAG: DUF3592 domain-containing protein [Planctomycetes bacterium]|nr:DUF3592 domain-containing protein [Planctomycetota bacterium]
MTRQFRPYGKKRGNRRTGSRALGSAGLVVLYLAFFFLGSLAMALIVARVVIPDLRVNQQFAEQKCLVLQTRLEPGEVNGARMYRPEVRILYEVDGKTYRTAAYDIARRYYRDQPQQQKLLDAFKVGQEYPCWHDPADPNRVVLVRGYTWSGWLLLLLPLSFIILGGAGLVYTVLEWGKSAERQSAIAQRAVQLEIFEQTKADDRQHPNIPRQEHLTDSPGTVLKFRLPSVTSPAWMLILALALSLISNGALAIFTATALDDYWRGASNWLLTLFLVPLTIAGVAAVVFFLRQLLIMTWVGPTVIEISEQPLRPGREYQLFLSQTGRLRMNALRLVLACDEVATYQQGTNTRTEIQRVHEQELFRREDFSIQHGIPFEAQLSLHVPSEAMHSFKSNHNRVEWKLLVQGDVVRWPNYERCFPIVVYPPEPARTTAA